MKRFCCILAALAFACGTISAVPAKPGPFKYLQPDGTTLVLYRYGDEFAHWTTDASGRVMEMDEDGFFRYSPDTPEQILQAGARRRAEANAQRTVSSIWRSSLTHGTRRIPVILVNFSDVVFTLEDPETKFYNLLNQEGYAENNGTGSVRDYYVDNSSGAFTPVFDVYGPVTLENPMKYYGGNRSGSGSGDKQPELALFHACQILDETVDLSVYDSDGDGVVDMTLFYYAGYNEAEGGSSNSIWPHQWDLSFSSNSAAAHNSFDGVHVGPYFCTSELSGGTGKVMCGIGTTCHEFAHSLGLPDFYDTDYSKNGSAGGLYSFSLMCNGCYNNGGKTPPWLNIEERLMLDWADEEPSELETGDYTLDGIQQHNRAFRSSTYTEGEYFLYECRDGSGWDAYIPTGLLVYHVDKAASHLIDMGTGYGSVTAEDLWKYWSNFNYINGNGKHPCFYIVPAQKPSSLMYTGKEHAIPFPGSADVRSYTPIDWDDEEIGLVINNIAYNAGEVSFHVESDGEKGVEGYVTDLYGNPVVGAEVTVDEAGASGAPEKRMLPVYLGRRKVASSVTDGEGHYVIGLADAPGYEFTVTVTADGFFPASAKVKTIRSLVRKDFKLRKTTEPDPGVLFKWDPDGNFSYIGLGATPAKMMGAVRFTPDELLPYVGLRIEKLMFEIGGTQADVHVLVEFGNERVLYRRVKQPRFDEESIVDVSDAALVIPDGKSVIIGYAIENGDNGYPMIFQEASEDHGSLYSDVVSEDVTDWYTLSYKSGTKVIYCDLKISASVVPQDTPAVSLASMGFNYISCSQEGELSVNESYTFSMQDDALEKPASVTWYLDGKKQGSGKITFKESGIHTVSAALGYEDGRSEVVDLEVSVK